MSVWAEKLWTSYHCIAWTYPQFPSLADKCNYKIFYENAARLIPCKQCLADYQQLISSNQLDDHLNSHAHLFQFTVNVHNAINERRDKPALTLEDAIDRYASLCDSYAAKALNVREIVTRWTKYLLPVQLDECRLDDVNESMWKDAETIMFGRGVAKKEWGPELWKALHCAALNYPTMPSVSDKCIYEIFYMNGYRLIPCAYCCKNYSIELKARAVDLSNSLDSALHLFEWTVDVHNDVNMRKHHPLMSHQNALNNWRTLCKEYPILSSNALSVPLLVGRVVDEVIAQVRAFVYWYIVFKFELV